MGRGFVDGSKTKGGKAYRQSEDLKDLIRLRDKCICQLCGGFGWDVDHIVPHAEGGLSVLENLRVLCHRCNCQRRGLRKDARLPLDDYYRQLEAELAERELVAVG